MLADIWSAKGDFIIRRGQTGYRGEKPSRGVGSDPGERQDWQRISGKMRRKSMPVLSVPGELVGGDEVGMAVFHELSRAEGPSQQTGLPANFRQSQPEIHGSLVSPRRCGRNGHRIAVEAPC